MYGPHLACAALLTAGCGAESFHHGESGEDSLANITVTISSGGTADLPETFDGNYPEPAVTRCGDVLGDQSDIDGLRSAWAIIAVPGATRSSDPVESGTVLLRLSEGVLQECGDESLGFVGTTGFTGNPEGRSDSQRGLELVFGPGELAKGVHAVSDLRAPDVALFGTGASETYGAGATVELLRVDDDCIIGVVRGFESDTGLPFMEGGFVAQTCQRQCLPSADAPC